MSNLKKITRTELHSMLQLGQTIYQCDLSDLDLYKMKIRNAVFEYCIFNKTNFHDTDVHSTIFDHCDLTNCMLAFSALHSCRFLDCNVTAINMDQCLIRNLEVDGCEGICDAGRDYRGFQFFGIKQHDGSIVIKAGCRWFSLEHAIEHWTENYHNGPDGQTQGPNHDALLRIRVMCNALGVEYPE